jgi:peptidoglycan/xylan/chitin deacetylase (PgdA/CDA1 family)
MRRRLVVSVDLDEWYHCRWATGSPGARWKDTAAFFREHYGSDRPRGDLVEPSRRVLGLLDRLGVRASFFVLGEVAGFYPDLVREIAARGHEVGCHGFHHVDADLLGPDGFRRELEESAAALRSLLGRSVEGYRAPNLLLRDWMIPALRGAGFRYDASVCTARGLLGKDFGHRHRARHPYRFSESFSRPDPRGDLVEVPLPVFPWLRLPAGTGILTRVLGGAWSTLALRHALRTGDTQYYFHPYELGALPHLRLHPRERIFLRRLGPWLECWIEGMVEAFRRRGVRFVTARGLRPPRRLPGAAPPQPRERLRRSR